MPDIDFREFFRENKQNFRTWAELALIFIWACLRLIGNLPWVDVLLVPVAVMSVVRLVRAVKLGYKYRIYWEIGRILSTAALAVCLALYNKYPEMKYIVRVVAVGFFLLSTVRNKV